MRIYICVASIQLATGFEFEILQLADIKSVKGSQTVVPIEQYEVLQRTQVDRSGTVVAHSNNIPACWRAIMFNGNVSPITGHSPGVIETTRGN